MGNHGKAMLPALRDRGPNWRRRPAAVVAALTLLLGAVAPPPQQGTPDATTPYFVFYNDLATNLNDALIAAGTERRFGRPELFQEGVEASCFAALPATSRQAWEQAVTFYAETIMADGGQRQVFLLRIALLGLEDEATDSEDVQLVETASALRSAAAPAYEACRWARQEGRNREWVQDITSQLPAFEETIAARLEALYATPFEGLPIRVDVVETVSWSGANSILLFPGGHLLISNQYRGRAGLEIIFHEASHVLMGRGAPVRRALADAAGALGGTLPGDLWHVVLFYTTGEVVRRVLEQAGEPGYVPMVLEIFGRGTWSEYQRGIEAAWPPYLDGERSLAAAASDLMKALAATPEEGVR